MRFNSLPAAAALALLSAVPAAAEKRDFHQCDGLSNPGKGGESGMAPALSTSGFAFPSSPGAKTVIDSCTAALADPRLQPRQALRRSHLLRARAVAQLQAGNPDAALADVDAAIAAAGPLASDPLFARSMGGSFELIRAAAALAKGNRAEARRLAAVAAARRPYSASIQMVAATVGQRARDPGAAGGTAFTTLVPIVPDALKLQFLSELEAGRFAAATAIYPRLPKPAAPAFPVFNLYAQLDPLLIASGAGYAFAATGHPDRARAIMADARTRLDTSLAPRTDDKGKPLPALDMIAQPLRTYLERNTGLVEARALVADRKPLDALKLLVGRELPVNAQSIELLTALKAALPAEQRALAPDPALLETKLAEQRKAETLDVAALRRGMAAPETSRTMADYQKAQSGFLYSFFAGAGASSDGFKSKTDAQTGITTVEFIGNAASQPTVEELTLLRAADLARAAGKPGFIILARRDYSRVMQMTQGYSRIPISSTPAGFRSELDVRFVDPAALPPELASERDRVLDVATVWSTLAPLYVPATPPARPAS